MLDVATIDFIVEPRNENDPVISTNAASNIGYIEETSFVGTAVRSAVVGTQIFQFTVTDADLVSY